MKKATPKESPKETRPPIVVVMGHVDHGKTKILDWYRKTKVVEQESGGITQHIGAYEVEHNGKKITFIDTPGHQAFSKMRSRGAGVADIAILVVAADEGIKPQTKEAIEIIKKNNLSFVVAINKIDKPEANIDRIKQQLAEEEILVESYGGRVPSVAVSAKNGDNMDELLEIILLLSELENLRADPEKPPEGVVIEAHLDPKRGITSTLLIRNGEVIQGDTLVIGRSIETIKILEDFLGHSVKKAAISSPIRVVGLTNIPAVGDTFIKFTTRGDAEKFVETLPEKLDSKPTKKTVVGEETEDKPVFNLIIKADVAGSKEVLEESFQKFGSDAIRINIIRSEVGNINESDVKLALATKLVTIIGFKVKIEPAVKELAERSNIHIVPGEVIYEIMDEAKKQIEEMIPPVVKRLDIGKAKILKVFSAKGGKKDGAKQIVGGKVEDGLIKKAAKVEINRLKETLGVGTIIQLQHNKIDAQEVLRGSEFGMLLESKTTVEVGDTLDAFEEETIKIKL